MSIAKQLSSVVKMIGFREFINAIEPSKRESVRKYFEKLKVSTESKIREELKIDQESRRFVNLCIYPFSLKGKLSITGYRFYCVDPLLYLSDKIKKAKNFDVLHHNENDESCIFVESRSGTNFSEDWWSEIENKVSTVEKFIQKEVGMDFNESEFVLMVESIIKDKVLDSLKKSSMKNKMVVWSADLWKGIIQLSYGKHSNQRLNQLLFGDGVKLPNFNNIIGIMPSSHIGNKLEFVSAMLEIKLRESQRDRFTISDICEILRKEFGNYPPYAIEKIADSILQEGVKSEIYLPLGDEEPLSKFFRVSVGRRMGMVGIDAKEEYIKFKTENDALNELYRHYPDVLESIKNKGEKGNQKKLTDMLKKITKN